MIQLSTSEARILGVLIEKGFTTPNQYPLSLNAIANGASQLSNRDPVMPMSDDQAFDAAEGLRNKGLAVRVDQVGSRVHKYKHIAVDTLHCRQAEVAILAELLLRGPQTVGELRPGVAHAAVRIDRARRRDAAGADGAGRAAGETTATDTGIASGEICATALSGGTSCGGCIVAGNWDDLSACGCGIVPRKRHFRSRYGAGVRGRAASSGDSVDCSAVGGG